jgi:hypothetical protein
MKFVSRGFIGLFSIAAFFGALPSMADAPLVIVSAPNVFSYQAPAGWTVQTPDGAKYPSATDIKDGGVNGGMIAVEVETKPGPLEDWGKESLAKNRVQWADYNLRESDLTPFETAAGAKGFRTVLQITAQGKDLQWTLYLFAGSSDAKIAVSCASPAEIAEKYAPIFDAAMKTFVAR